MIVRSKAFVDLIRRHGNALDLNISFASREIEIGLLQEGERVPSPQRRHSISPIRKGSASTGVAPPPRPFSYPAAPDTPTRRGSAINAYAMNSIRGFDNI